MNPNDYNRLAKNMQALLRNQEYVIVAIDGRCASGKTTLANTISKEFSCNVLHMDDFYLPFDKRDADWKTVPAKNINFQKVKEILERIQSKSDYSFSPYQCSTASYLDLVIHHKKPLTIVEGSYSCHPELQAFFDLRVFLTADPTIQKERLIEREGATAYLQYQNLWIPLEEAYFEKYGIQKICNFILS